MIDHDKVVGELLNLVDKMGLTKDTIVQYSACSSAGWLDGVAVV